MRRLIARRFLIAVLSLWVALSIVFLTVDVGAGDFVSAKLTNLENQGAQIQPIELLGSVVATETTVVAPPGKTLRSIADEQDIPLDELLEYNPDRSADEPLPFGGRVVTLQGQRLSDIAVEHRVALPEEAAQGADTLRGLNPDLELRQIDGEPWVPAGTTVKLRDHVSVAELARVYRITADDILEANPDGNLSAETLLYPGDWIAIPFSKVTSAQIRHRLGIDRSLGAQYGSFLWDAVRFKFGASFQTQQSALSHVAEALPRTVQLNLYSLLIALIVGAPLGLAAARWRSTRAVSALRGFGALALAVPSFWLLYFLIGIVVAEGFFFENGLWSIPFTEEAARDITNSPSGFFALYSLPATAGALPLTAAVAAAIAPADGAQVRDLRSIARSLLASLRFQLPLLIGFHFILELAQGIPGLGLALFQTINQADAPVVSAIVCVTALFLVFSYFAIDIARDRLGPAAVGGAAVNRARAISQTNVWRIVRAQPLAAFGLLILLLWSIAAIGAIGGGAGWMRIARYDPGDTFRIANTDFAESQAANALDGQPSDLSRDQLSELLAQPDVYGEFAASMGVTDDMIGYIEDLIADDALIERLTAGRDPLLLIEDGRFALAPQPITAIIPRPTTTASLQGPSWRHWFGTDRAGNDTYALLINAAWSPLMISFLAALFGVAAGAILGAVQRLDGGRWSEWLDALGVGLYALPPLLLVLLLAWTGDLSTVAWSATLGAFALLPAARRVREAESLRAAAPPLLGLFGMLMAVFALTDAALHFTGLGIVEGTWGYMIANGRQYIVEAPWLSLFPGLALTSVAFAAHTLGRGLQRLTAGARHDPT